MGRRSWSAVVVLLFTIAAIGHVLTRGHAAPTPPQKNATVNASDALANSIAGRATCSGRACHGGLEPNASGVRQNEFTTWIMHDKHARAFDVLTGERGRRIGHNLGIAHPEKDARCLACHTTPQLAGAIPEDLIPLRADGVGCEACHGPAKAGSGAHSEGWLVAHVTAEWKKLEGKAKEAAFEKHGMTPLFDLEVQAKTCAGCHVGAPADPAHGIPARDLNHDLMAAGHPRLMFELSTYRANMPPHWRTDLHARTPGYEALVWAIGQIEAAKASAELSADRAKRAADGKAPWPEFAEAACFSCHADLRSPSWRRATPDYYAGRTPGAIPANRWYAALLPTLEGVAKAKAAPADKALRDLAAELNKPAPNPTKVTALAEAATKDLNALLAAVKPLSMDAANLKALTEGLAKQADTIKQPDWDELAQIALAAAALRDAAGKGTSPEALQPLDGVFRQLAFPSPYESPEGYTPRAKAEGQTEDLHARLLKLLQDMSR
jgi:hypothetical protein